jgi:hypothetical protein
MAHGRKHRRAFGPVASILQNPSLKILTVMVKVIDRRALWVGIYFLAFSSGEWD